MIITLLASYLIDVLFSVQRYKKYGEITLTSLKTGTFLITIKDWVGETPQYFRETDLSE